MIGLSLDTKTINENGQSAIDCGRHWQKFEVGKYADRISGKLTDEIFAVYYNYEGDYSKPYSYFIGCRVEELTDIPEGMASLTIPQAHYAKFIARGEMPGCVANEWVNIWESDLRRAYQADFEIYDERSTDWQSAEVGIYVGVLN